MYISSVKLGALFLVLSIGLGFSPSYASGDYHSWMVDLKSGLNPSTIYFSQNSITYPTVNYTGGALVHFYFIPTIGIFVGAEGNTRAVELASGTIAKPAFVDIPIGFSFRHRGAFGIESATTTLKFGGFYSAPTNDLMDGSLLVARTRGVLGIMVESAATFPIYSTLGLGPFISLKYGLDSPAGTFSASSMNALRRYSNFVDLGMGFIISMQF